MTCTSPNLTKAIIHIGTHNHVVDDFEIKTFNKRMEEMIKKTVHEKPKASPCAIKMCVVENIIMEKVMVDALPTP